MTLPSWAWLNTIRDGAQDKAAADRRFVVACVGSTVNLTHCTPMERKTAEEEAASFRRSDRFGARYVVLELREVA